MTVKELIEELKKFPEDMEVLDYEYGDIDVVEIDIPHNYGYECVIVK